MVTNEVVDQFTVGDAIGSFALWSWKYVKDFVEHCLHNDQEIDLYGMFIYFWCVFGHPFCYDP